MLLPGNQGRKMENVVMKVRASMYKAVYSLSRFKASTVSVMLVVLAGVPGAMAPAAAQTNTQAHPFSFYIPTGIPTATSTMFSSGASISPGRIGVDKSGNVYYISHVSGAASTLYELPATGSVLTSSTPQPLITGLGQKNANSVFVDAGGTLWVSNGNGSGGSLIEIPALAGIPGTAAITGNGNYGATTGLPLSNITAACVASPTAPCVYSASGVVSNLTSLQIADLYSDGAGNVYIVDASDSISSGSYNRVLEFNTATAGTSATLADRLTSNSYAQITVAGDGNLYYCDSVTGNAKGGLVSVISGGTLTTVANLSPAYNPGSAYLTVLNAGVKVTTPTGVTTDSWGNLIISGPIQISEIPLETGGLNFNDQFNLLLAVSGANSPVYTNNIVYGGTFDVHGSYYYATATNIMQTQVNGFNFGQVNLGALVTSNVPFLNLTWGVPSYLETSLVATASPNTLPVADAAYLQSFPFSGTKSYFGGTPYSASTPGQYTQLYFQPVHPGLLRGALSPQGFSTALEATDTNYSTDLYLYEAFQANMQGVGVGPQPMFLPGTPSTPVTLSQLYTSYKATKLAVGFTPMGVAVDSFGNIFVPDTANTSLDLDCLAATQYTAQIYRAAAANAGSGPGYTNSYCLTDGIGDTTSPAGLTGLTFKVSATGFSGVNFPTSFVNPVDTVIDGANNAYVLDSASGTSALTKLSFTTMIPSVVIPSGTIVGGVALNSPEGMAIDGYSNIFISDTLNNRIVQAHQYNATYSQNSVYVPSSTTFGGTALNRPQGLGLDPAGNLFIADTGNQRVVEYSLDGVASVVATKGVTLANPTSVKVLPSGALIVADSTLGLILVNGGNASLLSTGSTTLYSTQGMTIDQFGNVFVADPVGQQVVELNFSVPATATSFPPTLIGASSTETSYIFNEGNAPLVFSAAPTTSDGSTATSNEFGVDTGNTCTNGASLAPNASCSLVMDFTPVSSAIQYVYSYVPGTVTVADNLQSYTLIANPNSTAEDIGSFGTTGGTQTVQLKGYPTVPETPQTITFTAPAPITWSSGTLQFNLVATGGASGQPVTFSIVRGQGTLSGPNNSVLTVPNFGSTVIAANQAGKLVGTTYYAPAPQVVQTAVVNPLYFTATPTFSVAQGTYTSVQSVTISDATAGATIYYTTNGNKPTLSSPVYTPGTPISVPITTTIQAFALLPQGGYAASPIASVTYTLNPDFVLFAYQTTFNIPAGLSGGATLSISPLFGFDAPVTFSCSGLPSGDTCSFIPQTIPALSIAQGATGYSALTIHTTGTASLGSPGKLPFAPKGPYAPVGALAVAVFLFSIRKRKRLLMVVLVMASAAGASLLNGCSSSSASSLQPTTFTLTATSGSVVHSQTITLIVNNF